MESKSEKITVPMNVKWQPGWISWVAATTTCLKALGVKCDQTDVAGYSGYAFVFTVHDQLCPSGPTVFEWGSLMSGINYMGRSTLDFMSMDCHTKELRSDRTEEHCKQVFELVKREIEAGRPCVLWGAYVPEFATVYGIEDENYLVKSYKQVLGQKEKPLLYTDLEAPGGPYMLAFPSKTKGEISPAMDRYLIANAVEKLSTDLKWARYKTGLAAYEQWITALEENEADGFGNSYNAQCWAECKHYARDFIERLANRNESVKEPLMKAVEHYGGVVEAMDKIAKIFPFMDVDAVREEKNRTDAIELLKKARNAETKAVEAMNEALEMKWE